MPTTRIELPTEKIADFCRRWSIATLEVFGSVLRDDFRPDSDVDFIAKYLPEAHWSLLDRVHMKHELEDMLGREVDLLNRRALEHGRQNSRAAAILAEAQLVYARS
jgi:predicted nucleotidyltransferase